MAFILYFAIGFIAGCFYNDNKLVVRAKAMEFLLKLRDRFLR
jgi:hypothetical protein